MAEPKVCVLTTNSIYSSSYNVLPFEWTTGLAHPLSQRHLFLEEAQSHPPRSSERPSRQEARVSLCKALGSLLFLCILLAILHPVWEFQEHLPLSLAQPHMCEPQGRIMFIPAAVLSLAVNQRQNTQNPRPAATPAEFHLSASSRSQRRYGDQGAFRREDQNHRGPVSAAEVL